MANTELVILISVFYASAQDNNINILKISIKRMTHLCNILQDECRVIVITIIFINLTSRLCVSLCNGNRTIIQINKLRSRKNGKKPRKF